MSSRHHKSFLKQFVSQPNSVGAIAPSSTLLCQEIVNAIDWSTAQAVVEYGPGTGVVTQQILKSKRDETNFCAIELNTHFAEILKQRFTSVSIHVDSVANVKDVCEHEGIEQVDAVISGLPWASFKDEDQNEYLDAMMSVLKPGGHFVTFAYLQGLLLPAGKRFRHKLDHYFTDIGKSRIIWRNLPPAFVYRCRR